MNPLCEKCGEVCLVCSQCNVEFICSCDEPEHNCPMKETCGVKGSPFALYCKLLNIKEVFDGNANLDIDDKGKPLLIGWHISKEGEDKNENGFEYVDGHWLDIIPDSAESYDDYNTSPEFDADYDDISPKYED